RTPAVDKTTKASGRTADEASPYRPRAPRHPVCASLHSPQPPLLCEEGNGSIRCYLSLRGNFRKLAQWHNLSMSADNPVNLDVCIIDAGKERHRVFNAQSIRRIDGGT